jgi:tetratricopeptide (TPR) repeat protein
VPFGLAPAGSAEESSPVFAELRASEILARNRALEKESLDRMSREQTQDYVRKAEIALLGGESAQAMRALLNALRISPNEPAARRLLKEGFFRSSREEHADTGDFFDEAEKPLTREETRVMRSFFLKRGDLWFKKKAYDRAVEEYENVFLIDPMNAQASQRIDAARKTLVAEKKREWRRRRTLKSKALADETVISLRAAEALMREKRYWEAKVMLNRLAFLDPSQRRLKQLLRELEKETGKDSDLER